MDVNVKKTQDTFVNQKIQEINWFSDKTINVMRGKKFMRFWANYWTAYYITYVFIAPLLKSTFLIASWTSLLIFYWLIAIIGFILANIFNTILKLLLYIFKS